MCTAVLRHDTEPGGISPLVFLTSKLLRNRVNRPDQGEGLRLKVFTALNLVE